LFHLFKPCRSLQHHNTANSHHNSLLWSSTPCSGLGLTRPRYVQSARRRRSAIQISRQPSSRVQQFFTGVHLSASEVQSTRRRCHAVSRRIAVIVRARTAQRSRTPSATAAHP
jgi:hypothetical protein